MKKLIAKIALSLGMLCPMAAQAGNYWQEISAARAPKQLQVIKASSFRVYTMDETSLKMQMWNLSTDPADR